MGKSPIYVMEDQPEEGHIPPELLRLPHWIHHPVHYVREALGAEPDPWQCDALDALAEVDRVALRSCHGPGKTTVEAWAVLWFVPTRPLSKAPTTAPTFGRQVRDLLWTEMHKWWYNARSLAPAVFNSFEIQSTRFRHKQREDWFAVGIASEKAVNMEGYHAPHVLVVFDEAKAIKRAAWDATRGMLTAGSVCACGHLRIKHEFPNVKSPGRCLWGQCECHLFIPTQAKILAASTPGGKLGEFYKVFTQYRSTWKHTFVIHPRALQGHEKLASERPMHRDVAGEILPGVNTYYSDRVAKEWVEDFRTELGEDNPIFISRVMGEFPDIEGDVLIPMAWLERAAELQEGAPGGRVISCDVARHGRDRTVALVGEGGNMVHCESIARYPAETTAPEIEYIGTGPDPKHPLYRGVVATAMMLRRLHRDWSAEMVAVDETGVGGGVVDLLRWWGIPCVGINFGAPPTDKPNDPDVLEMRRRKGLRDTIFANIKAQMGLAIQRAFGNNQISLARLQRHVLDILIQQAAQMGLDIDALGRIRLVDPDDREEQEAFEGAADIEGRRSPDHFHSLMINWWVSRRYHKPYMPAAGAPQIPAHIAQIGEPSRGNGQLGWQRGAPGLAPAAGKVGGQGAWVQRRYR